MVGLGPQRDSTSVRQGVRSLRILLVAHSSVATRNSWASCGNHRHPSILPIPIVHVLTVIIALPQVASLLQWTFGSSFQDFSAHNSLIWRGQTSITQSDRSIPPLAPLRRPARLIHPPLGCQAFSTPPTGAFRLPALRQRGQPRDIHTADPR